MKTLPFPRSFPSFVSLRRAPVAGSRRKGWTLLELMVAILVLTTVLVPVTLAILHSSAAFASITVQSHAAARATAVMDRLVKEITNARFVSLTPPIPDESPWIRFQRIVDVVNDEPVYGEPIQIELVSRDPDAALAADADADADADASSTAAIEEAADADASSDTDSSSATDAASDAGAARGGSIRLWVDHPPYSLEPGPEDEATILATGLAPAGLRFTRHGAFLSIETTYQVFAERGRSPFIFELRSGVLLRQGETSDSGEIIP